MATCSGVSFILVYATFEDFVTRLDGKGNSMVSILQITQNFAYAFGPIFFGLISQDNNFTSSFIAGGEILIFFSALALLTIPRKIKMPHKEIAEKIIKGGTGVWGSALMTPHASLAQEDAEAMVKYILLLKK